MNIDKGGWETIKSERLIDTAIKWRQDKQASEEKWHEVKSLPNNLIERKRRSSFN